MEFTVKISVELDRVNEPRSYMTERRAASYVGQGNTTAQALAHALRQYAMALDHTP